MNCATTYESRLFPHIYELHVHENSSIGASIEITRKLNSPDVTEQAADPAIPVPQLAKSRSIRRRFGVWGLDLQELPEIFLSPLGNDIVRQKSEKHEVSTTRYHHVFVQIPKPLKGLLAKSDLANSPLCELCGKRPQLVVEGDHRLTNVVDSKLARGDVRSQVYPGIRDLEVYVVIRLSGDVPRMSCVSVHVAIQGAAIVEATKLADGFVILSNGSMTTLMGLWRGIRSAGNEASMRAKTPERLLPEGPVDPLQHGLATGSLCEQPDVQYARQRRIS